MAYRRKVNIGASWHRGLIRNKTRDQTALTLSWCAVVHA